MENSAQSNGEIEELESLLELIERGDCVLVLGPRVAIRANDPVGRPLEELLACELWSKGSEPPLSLKDLHRAAEYYCNYNKGNVLARTNLQLKVRDFYAREAGLTTDFHRDLARLPFRVCLSASPDSLMLNAFRDANKSPQKGYYHFKPKPSYGNSSTALTIPPTPDRPLVYYLFGHYEDPTSLVLTEGDLIEFLVAIVSGNPPVPDIVRSIMEANGKNQPIAILFLGFGFHNWYLRVLLHVLKVYGHPSIAFEDAEFFNHPDHEQTVGFFTGDRLIDFRPLRWQRFAKQLRETYEATIRETSAPAPTSEPASLKLPKAFISYAHEDKDAVEALAKGLKDSQIDVWYDQENLYAGERWNETLLNTIMNEVNYVIVLQTQTMITKERGVFRREIDAALECEKEMGEFEGKRLRFLIPVKIGSCETLSSLKHLEVVDLKDAHDVEPITKSIKDDWDRRARQKKEAA